MQRSQLVVNLGHQNLPTPFQPRVNQFFFDSIGFFLIAKKQVGPVADLHSKILDAHPRSNFLLFHAVFR